MNKTKGKKDDWESYYTPDIVDQAQRYFGPLVKKWGYDFPPIGGAMRFLGRSRQSSSCFVF